MNKIYSTTYSFLTKQTKIDQNKSVWILTCTLLIAFSAIPIFSIEYLPITDLPQHLAQVHLFYQNLHQTQSEYEINYFNPNLLIYWIMILLWKIGDPILVGKITVYMIIILWLISIFLLGFNTNRSLASTVLLSTLTFNTIFYWGFINFLIGFFFFSLFLITMLKEKKIYNELKQGIMIFLLTLLLLLSHALWFLMGCFALILFSIVQKNSKKQILIKLISVSPIVIFASIWFITFSENLGYTNLLVSPAWIVSPLSRFSPQWILENLYGGINSQIVTVLLILLTMWIIIYFISNRKSIKGNVNIGMFLLAVFLLVFVFFAPQLFKNTILFASRWFPIAIILLVFSFQKLKFNELFISFLFLLTFIVLIFETKLKWQEFEIHEMDGFSTSISKLDPNSKLIGLDYLQKSDFIYGKPFMQIFAYAQVFKNSDLNFTFALHQNGIVRTRNFEKYKQWTPGLEWIPEYVRYEDLSYFDYALIGAKEDLHQYFSEDNIFKPITTSGTWRLYKCNKNTDKKGFLFIINFYNPIHK